ncbi:MAG: rod shape-determining protein MreD [Crocinitomicaceae bacterium]
MNNWVKYISLFILVVLFQGLVVNNMQFSEYINPMVYPVMIMMLPFELSVVATMAVALLLGLSVDAFSDTFGLHASAALLIGYLRAGILRYIQPKEGYDSALQPSIHDMNMRWFLPYTSTLLLVHHLWFFSVEILRFDLMLLILGKTFISFFFSLTLIIIFQYIFYKPSKK